MADFDTKNYKKWFLSIKHFFKKLVIFFVSTLIKQNNRYQKKLFKKQVCHETASSPLLVLKQKLKCALSESAVATSPPAILETSAAFVSHLADAKFLICRPLHRTGKWPIPLTTWEQKDANWTEGNKMADGAICSMKEMRRGEGKIP